MEDPNRVQEKGTKIMNDSSIGRWIGPVGLLGVLSVFVGVGPLSGSSPGENAPGASVAAYYNSHVVRNWVAVYLVTLGTALLVVFLVHVRTILRRSGSETLANSMFAASILLLAAMMVSAANEVALILAAHNHENAIVHTLNFLNVNSQYGIVFGIGLVTFTTGLCILLNTESPLPKLLGWYSILVAAVCCAGPFSGLAVLFGFPVWTIAIGFLITVRTRRGTLGKSGKRGLSTADDS
jgi:hypothetical protein